MLLQLSWGSKPLNDVAYFAFDGIKLRWQAYKNFPRIMENAKQELEKVERDIGITEAHIPFMLLQIPWEESGKISLDLTRNTWLFTWRCSYRLGRR